MTGFLASRGGRALALFAFAGAATVMWLSFSARPPLGPCVGTQIAAVAVPAATTAAVAGNDTSSIGFAPVLQCGGLDEVPDSTLNQCMDRCAESQECCDWQFHPTHGCWQGTCKESLEQSLADWVGGNLRAHCKSDAFPQLPEPEAAPQLFKPVIQCDGLEHVHHDTAEGCMVSCITSRGCCDWQYNPTHGCWLGTCRHTLEQEPTEWVGGNERSDCKSDSLSQLGGEFNAVPGKLAVVVVVRNAAARIREWLAFHVAQGVDHVFVIDDESTDNLAAALEPAIRRNFVTVLPASLMAAKILHPIKSTSWQSTIYNNVFFRFGALFTWFGVWDVDEFMYASGTSNLPDTLQAIRSQFPDCSGVCVNWEIMGSMGLYDKTEGLMTETFTEVFENNNHVKCIALSKRTREVWVHNHVPLQGYRQYLETGQLVNTFRVGNAENLASRKLHLNHYYHVSREEFAARIAASRWPYKKVEHWKADRGQPQQPGLGGAVPAMKRLLAEWEEDDHGGGASTRVARVYSAWDSGI